MKLLLIVSLLITGQVFSQTEDSDKYIEFKNKLSGVKYADFQFNQTQLDIMIHQENQLSAYDINGMREFLIEDLKLNGVVITPDQRNDVAKNTSSICDVVNVNWNISDFISDFMAVGRRTITFNFTFCDNSKYTFTSDMNVNGNTRDYKKAFKKALSKKIANPFQYDSTSTLILKRNEIVISEDSLKNVLGKKAYKKDIEGIFQLFKSETNTNPYKIGIIEIAGNYKIVYLGGLFTTKDWSEGELKGALTPTMSKSSFLCKWVTALKSLENATITSIDINTFDINYSNTKSTDRYIRVY